MLYFLNNSKKNNKILLRTFSTSSIMKMDTGNENEDKKLSSASTASSEEKLNEIHEKYFKHFSELEDINSQHIDTCKLLTNKILKVKDKVNNEDGAELTSCTTKLYSGLTTFNKIEDRLAEQHNINDDSTSQDTSSSTDEGMDLEYEKKYLDIFKLKYNFSNNTADKVNSILDKPNSLTERDKQDVNEIKFMKDSLKTDLDAKWSDQEKLLNQYKDIQKEYYEAEPISETEQENTTKEIPSTSHVIPSSSTSDKTTGGEPSSDSKSNNNSLTDLNSNRSMVNNILPDSESYDNKSNATDFAFKLTWKQWLLGCNYNVEGKSTDIPINFVVDKLEGEPYNFWDYIE